MDPRSPITEYSRTNNPSAGSVGASDILGGTADRDTPRNTPQKKSKEMGKTNRKKTEKATAPLLQPHHYELSVLGKDGHESLHTVRRTELEACIVTIDTGASVNIDRPDITARLLERTPPTKCALQTVKGHLEALVTMILGRCPLTTWVFVANITDESILGLDVMQAHDTSVDLRCHML
jgi:hypothetical protein